MSKFFGILTNPHTRAYYAAIYEAEQAERDFTEAYERLMGEPSMGAAYGPEDYALWSIGGYAESALRVVRTMPVREA